jgi:hypothetical protein
MRDNLLRSLPGKAKLALVFLVGTTAEIALERLLKIWVPEGQEASFIVRVLQSVRDIAAIVRSDWLLVGAGTAFGLYIWDERRRWLTTLRRLWSRLRPTKDGVFAPSPVAHSSRPQSPDQKDRKIRALDKLRTQARKMHYLINRAERLSSGAWNAFVGGKGLEYSNELRAFRDEFETEARELNSLRDQFPEYDDAIAATRMPDEPKWIRDIGDHLVISQALFNYLKEGTPNDVFVRLASEDAEAFSQFVQGFIRWHNNARACLDQLCREVAA